MELLNRFKDPELCKRLLAELDKVCGEPLRFMEVCGTHTVAIFQSGLRSLLPEAIIHLSGPGCPVCVTHESEVDAYLELAGRDGVVIATFGDLMKVPGRKRQCLKAAQAEGARVEVVYSAFDALELAARTPDAQVVFLGVGFETTAPTTAATVQMAKARGLENFKLLSFHKLVPPALEALLADPDTAIDAFILPGHVSTIIGREPYRFIAERYKRSAVIAGFEPVDILRALLDIARMRDEAEPRVVNDYKRAVADEGNPRAREIMDQVFANETALWRGIGAIPGSGLALRKEFAAHDAKACFDIEIVESPPLPGCRCGDVLKGRIPPPECP
ncbi:MAG: hydrogenase formation protein HypD, partial [Desulfovibrionaceae bacterium]